MWWEMGASFQRSTYGYVPKTISRWRIYFMQVKNRMVSLKSSQEEPPQSLSFLALTHVFRRRLLSAGCISHSPRCFYGFHKVPDHLRSRCCTGGKEKTSLRQWHLSGIMGDEQCVPSRRGVQGRGWVGGGNCHLKGLIGDSLLLWWQGREVPSAARVTQQIWCSSEWSSILPNLSSVSPSPMLMFLKVPPTVESNWLSLKWGSLCS